MPSIEQSAASFARRVDAIKAATVDYVYDLGGGLSRQELAVLVDRIDFTALVDQLGYSGSVEALMGDYVSILRDLDPIAPLSDEVLEALANTDRAFYLSKGGDLASTMKQEIARGALLGSSRSEMKAALSELSGYRADQIQTLIDTSMRVYSRSVNVAMMNELPPDTKYYYFGPVDDKTRDICLDMASAGQLTEAEIASRWGSDVLVNGGGYNCRHEWRMVTTQYPKLNKTKEAQARIAEDK